jgi:hypothetical protein
MCFIRALGQFMAGHFINGWFTNAQFMAKTLFIANCIDISQK